MHVEKDVVPAKKTSGFQVKPNSHVLFSVSLIQDEQPRAQTGEEFNKMADDILVNPNVEKVTLMLADTLQRFRLMLKKGLTEEEAIVETKKLYHAFLENNKEKIEELRQKKKLEIIDWDYYRNTDEFRKEFLAIEKFYASDNRFPHLVNNRAKNQVEKIKEEIGDKCSEDIASTLMKKYLFEESTFQVVAANDNEKKYNYEYYKTKRNQTMAYVHGKRVRNIKLNRMQEISYAEPLQIKEALKSQEQHAHSLGVNSQTFFNSNNGGSLSVPVLTYSNQELMPLAIALCSIVEGKIKEMQFNNGVDKQQASVYFFTHFMNLTVTELPIKYMEEKLNEQKEKYNDSIQQFGFRSG